MAKGKRPGVLTGGNLVTETKKAYTDKEFIKVVAGMEWTYDLVKRGEKTKALFDAESIELLQDRYMGLPVEVLIPMFIDAYHSSTAPSSAPNEIQMIVQCKMVAIGLELCKHLITKSNN